MCNERVSHFDLMNLEKNVRLIELVIVQNERQMKSEYERFLME